MIEFAVLGDGLFGPRSSLGFSGPHDNFPAGLVWLRPALCGPDQSDVSVLIDVEACSVLYVIGADLTGEFPIPAVPSCGSPYTGHFSFGCIVLSFHNIEDGGESESVDV